MASVQSLGQAPRCLSCLRRLWMPLEGSHRGPSLQQIRSKSKLIHRETLRVRLTKDIPRWGPKGHEVDVRPAHMRNYLFPRGDAEYLPWAELKAKRDQRAPRDHKFGTKVKPQRRFSLRDRLNERGTGREIEVTHLSSEKTYSILQEVVPALLEFQRTPIAEAASSPSSANATSESASSPMESGASLASKTATVKDTLSTSTTKDQSRSTTKDQPTSRTSKPSSSSREIPAGTPIFGSVTPADVVARVKALLQAYEDETEIVEASRIVLNPEDIRFVAAPGSSLRVDETKVKMLGEVEVEMRVRGGDIVRRAMRVVPMEAVN